MPALHVSVLLCATLSLSSYLSRTQAQTLTGQFQDPDPIEEAVDVPAAPLPPGVPEQAFAKAELCPSTGPEIPEPKPSQLSTIFHKCGCTSTRYINSARNVQSLRTKSDRWLADGDKPSPQGWTNMVWSWGQFIDHDLTGTFEDEGEEGMGAPFNITLSDPDEPMDQTMGLHRVQRADSDGECKPLKNALTPVIDAGPIYGGNKTFLDKYMREPDSCRLRTSAGDLLPTTTPCLEQGSKAIHRFVAGDKRVNEHAILTSMHIVWLREHNRLCDAMTADSEAYGDMSNEKKFELAKKVVQAKMQMITLHEFLPTLGIAADAVENYKSDTDTADVSVEFFLQYRFGHDLVPNKIGTFTAADIFEGETFYMVGADSRDSTDPAAANDKLKALIKATATSAAGALDGRFSDTLRNLLFGSFGQDLGSRNMFRSKEVGMKGYAKLRRCYGAPRNSAYWGTRAATILARGDVPFLSLALENSKSRDILGPVNKEIMLDQFHRSIFGKNGMWWRKDEAAVGAFKAEIVATTLGGVLNANVAGLDLPSDVFTM